MSSMPDTRKQRRTIAIFLVTLVVAICVEIAVDWNATFYEITVLRNSLQQKGENYADIMRQAATEAMLAYDWDALDRLSARLFDDEDVVYVRFTDVLGNTIYDRLRADWGNEVKKKRGLSFRAYYRRVMDRDARGIMQDPTGLRQKYESSRHKDVIQKFNDLQMAVVRKFSAPKEGTEEIARTLYQDRLAEKDGSLDRTVSYSVGAVTSELGEPFGAILIGFRNDRLNSGTRMKLWKGTIITLFFVGLIIFQNLGSRRSKMRLQALERALAQARAAVAGHEQLPLPDSGIVFHRVPTAKEVGGSLCITRLTATETETLLVDPEEPGIDGAFAVCALAEAFTTVAIGLPLHEQWTTLAAAFSRSPAKRPLRIALVHTAAATVEALATRGVRFYENDKLLDQVEVPASAELGATQLVLRPRTAVLIVTTLTAASSLHVDRMLRDKRGVEKKLAEIAEDLTVARDAWLFTVEKREASVAT